MDQSWLPLPAFLHKGVAFGPVASLIYCEDSLLSLFSAAPSPLKRMLYILLYPPPPHLGQCPASSPPVGKAQRRPEGRGPGPPSTLI